MKTEELIEWMYKLKREQERADTKNNRSRWSLFRHIAYLQSLGGGKNYRNWLNRRRRILKKWFRAAHKPISKTV